MSFSIVPPRPVQVIIMSMANVVKLSSLSAWSIQRIKDIFEGATDEDSLRSIKATFIDNVTATINGVTLPHAGITQLVLAMRKSSETGLRVSWHHTVDVARDPNTNREGSFGGYYVIRGLRKHLPGMSRPAEFERQKTVTVIIESQSSDPNIDSRRIVNLAFVASDVKVERQSSL